MIEFTDADHRMLEDLTAVLRPFDVFMWLRERGPARDPRVREGVTWA